VTSLAWMICPLNTDCVLWLGDFNCHHPMWEEDANEWLFKPEEYIALLIDLLYKNDMLLALPKGIPMLQTPAGNWTRPDNVWCSNTLDNFIICCDMLPTLRPPLADHLPVIIILDLPLPRAMAMRSLDFRVVDWQTVHSELYTRLDAESPVACIRTEAEFQAKVGNMVHILTEVLDKNLDEKHPNPYKWRWWTKELTKLKKEQNHLSSAAFKFHHLQDHPSHVEYKAAANRFKEVNRDQDWKDWLEAISQQDLYLANKYITSEPTDFSNTRIPTLHTMANRLAGLAESNAAKAEALVQSFFPPPPDASSIPPGQIYPEALQGPHFFSRSRI
jgi:hypothetical protein